jgi:hypothetical protein
MTTVLYLYQRSLVLCEFTWIDDFRVLRAYDQVISGFNIRMKLQT